MSFILYSLMRADESEYTDKVLKGEKYLAVMRHTCREVNYLADKKQMGFHPGTFRLLSIIVLYSSLAISQVLTVQSSEQQLYLIPRFWVSIKTF